MAGVVTVDDSQPNIAYSAGQWQRRTARNPNIFDGTLTMTSSAGATATLAFEGTGITVMGVVLADGTPPTSAYVLDDGNPVMFIAQPSRQNQIGVVFFRSPPLPFGVHQLSIINGNGQRGASPLILDAFVINTEPATPAPGPPAPNPPALPSVSPSPSTVATLSPSPSTNSTPTSATITTPLTTLSAQASPTISDLPPVIVTVTSQRSSAGSATPSVGANGALSGADNGNGAAGEKSGGGSNAGAIAGGIVAAIVGIGLLVVAFVYWRRRQRNRSRGGPQPLRRGHSSFWNKPAPANPSGSPPITPFVLDSELPESPPSQRRAAPPPPQMSQYQSPANPYGQSDPYSPAYQFATPPSQNIPPPIIANNRFSYADSMYTDGPGAREGEVDPYGGYTSATPAPPVPTSSSARPVLATPNPFYPQAVNTSVPTPTSDYGQSPFNNPPPQQQQPTRLQYNPAPQATSQYVPPSQLLNARLQGGGASSGFDSYGRGMPVPTADPSYASQSQGKRERIRLD